MQTGCAGSFLDPDDLLSSSGGAVFGSARTGDHASRVAKSLALAGRDRPGSFKFGGQPDEPIGSNLAQPGSIRLVTLAS